jgi:hypothetical protein
LPMAKPAHQTKATRHNHKHAIQYHTSPSPISGWLSGSTRRLSSSTLSPATSASAYLPRATYVATRVPVASPARRHKTKRIPSQRTNHIQHITPPVILKFTTYVLQNHCIQ